MISVALKMLIGNRSSFFGVVFGIFLATLLISQQSAIFLGLVARSYRMLTDIPSPNVWVIDPATESDEKVRSIPAGYLDIVRSTENIEWAVPINVSYLPIITLSGAFEICQLYGVDEASFIGAPQHMIEGSVKDLRREGGIIVDIYSASSSLATKLPDGTSVPLKVGDTLEINDHRAVVVGLCKTTRGFYPQPTIFTTNEQFHRFKPNDTNHISFIAAKTSANADIPKVLKKINSFAGLKALTTEDFKRQIADSFLKTGILINFGLSVGLGIIIGFSIAGQIFYIMTLQNLMYFALIKGLGGNKKMISKMIIFQAFVVGLIGYLLGTGATILWGIPIQDTTLAFLFPWQLLIFTFAIISIICIFTAGMSLRKIYHTEPKILMGN